MTTHEALLRAPPALNTGVRAQPPLAGCTAALACALARNSSNATIEHLMLEHAYLGTQDPWRIGTDAPYKTPRHARHATAWHASEQQATSAHTHVRGSVSWQSMCKLPPHASRGAGVQCKNVPNSPVSSVCALDSILIRLYSPRCPPSLLRPKAHHGSRATGIVGGPCVRK